MRVHEVRLEKLVLHDYGYSAKVGEAIVDCSEDVLESLHDETLEKTGADVTFVRNENKLSTVYTNRKNVIQ